VLATVGLGVAGALVGGIASRAWASAGPNTAHRAPRAQAATSDLNEQDQGANDARAEATHAAARGFRASAARQAAARQAAARQAAARAAAQQQIAAEHAAAEQAAARASRSQLRAALAKSASSAVTTSGSSFSGIASWYGSDFAGRSTASGSTYNEDGLSAASRTLPLGSQARVCRGGACVVVLINDRGPYVGGRILDLSRGAASALDMLGAGVAYVTVTPVG
jgi:rare lipoprotein A